MQNIHSFLPKDKDRKKQTELHKCKNGILIMISVLTALAVVFSLEGVRSFGVYAAEVSSPALVTGTNGFGEETHGVAQIQPIIVTEKTMLAAVSRPVAVPSAWKAEEEAKEPAVKKVQKEEKKASAKKKKINKNKIQISDKDKKILQRIVEAEATGQNVKGKLLVANVILNRVKSSKFPDTVEGVVFQRSGGKYQFSPVKDGRYYSVSITATTKQAVEKALDGEDISNGALYFMARKGASQKNARWFDNHLTFVAQYGGHEFFK